MAAPNGARQTTNTKKPVSALRRLKQDYMMLMNDPVPYVEAAPLPSNMLEWHYVIRGPEGSPYHNGIYHGKLRFPPDYPFKPPSIYMITPNGRFKPNSRLCLSISDFHPDTWNPTWNLSTILTGLLSFMLENNSTYGSIITSKREKQILAKKSYEYNLNDPLFCELFPDIADEIKDELEKRKEAERASANSTVNNAVKGIGNQISNLINSSDGGNRSAAGPAGRDSTAAATAATGPQSNRFIWSVLYNLIAVVILVIFFYVVRFILRESNLFGSSASS